MKSYTTWQKTALEPAFGMSTHGSASVGVRTLTCDLAAGVSGPGVAHVRLDAVRINGVFPGSHAWSPPIS